MIPAGMLGFSCLTTTAAAYLHRLRHLELSEFMLGSHLVK